MWRWSSVLRSAARRTFAPRLLQSRLAQLSNGVVHSSMFQIRQLAGLYPASHLHCRSFGTSVKASSTAHLQDTTLKEPLRVTIRSIIYHDPNNGYTVARVAEKRGDKPITVVGHMLTPWARAGEYVEVSAGKWTLSRDYGSQLHADRIEVILPDNKHEAEKYLSTFVSGVGPARAKKIVAALGNNALEVLEKQPHRLFEVDGIGRKALLKIQKSIEEHASSRAALEFLTEHGVGHGMAMQVWQHYGSATISAVQRNPYALIRFIPSFSFAEAQKLADKLSMDRASQHRVVAGLHDVLGKVLGRQGHCAAPRDEIVSKTSKVLRVDTSDVEVSLQAETEEERLTVRTVNTGDDQVTTVVQPSTIARSEMSIASHLVRLQTSHSHLLINREHGAPLPSNLLERLNPAARAEFERHSQALAPQQRDAVLQCLCSNVSVITGGPGVGKTWTLGSLIKIYDALNYNCVLCAPTGRAAARLQELTGHEATTIHRALESVPRTGTFLRNAANPLEAMLVVVDEASMLDVSLAASLFQAVASGAKLLLVGDVDQLPSVGPGRVLSDLISSGVVNTSRLTRVYRQQNESDIINAAHAINDGRVPHIDHCTKVEMIGQKDDAADVCMLEIPSNVHISKAIVQLVSDIVPHRYAVAPSSVQVLTPMNGGVLGSRNLNTLLQRTLNPPKKDSKEINRYGFSFREGDKVMQLVNDYEKGVFNGETGTIVRIAQGRGNSKPRIYCDFDRLKFVVYELKELDQIAPAYAITIHKSQGSEFPVVIIPAHAEHRYMLQRNLIYTAVTRARQLVVVVGSKKALQYAVDRTAGIGTERLTCLKECVREEYERMTLPQFPS